MKKRSESSERFFYMISQQIIKRLMCWRVIFHINKLRNFYGRFTNKCFPFSGLLCSAFHHPANDAICAIANLTWYSKYLLQYFSIYYRNLTLRVVMLLQLRSSQGPPRFAPQISQRAPFLLWDFCCVRKSWKIFRSPSTPKRFKITSLSLKAFLNGCINGRLNLQRIS